jgi:elongation factor G
MKRYQVPRIAFINKMDRTGANPKSVIKQISEKLGVTPVPLQVPIGAESRFEGVVDLVTMKALYYVGEKGDDVEEREIPEDYREEAEAARGEMLETLSLYSDELMEALLEERPITAEEIRPIIRSACLSHHIVPVMMGSAYKNKGIQTLLDAIVAYLPSPLDRTVTATDLSVKPTGEVAEDGTPVPADNRVTLTTDPSKPMVAMAFKIVEEAFGQLTYTRIYQGKIVKGETYVNTRTGKRTRIGRLVRMHADQRVDIETAGPGDIIALVGVDCASGDTFCGQGVEYALESIFVPEAVIRLSVEPLKRDGADKLAKALERFRREDPTFRVYTDEETGQTIIAGMGQLHLEIYIERIRREYKVECLVGEPRVAYKEYPTREVEFNFKHKKQTGGSGQYAHVVGKLVPLPLGSAENYVFENDVTQGRIPKEYIEPVNQGFQRALPKGPLCECEVVGVKMILEDGSYHDVDSSEMAFNICGFNCMRETLKNAGIGLLEPIMRLEVEVPTEYQGTVSGHISSKRGIINSSEVRSGVCYLLAEVPLASMFDYANELRSMTQGKGGFSMEFAHYKPVPKSIMEEVVTRRRAEKEERMALAR